MDLCRHLRWKAWYHEEHFTDETLAHHVARNEVPYSCLRTCQPWGPDDAAAAPELCDRTRGCFTPSPKKIVDVT